MSNNYTVGMDTNKINEYVYAFRSALRKYLKKGVSIKTVSYPFDSGAVNVINYSFLHWCFTGLWLLRKSMRM